MNFNREEISMKRDYIRHTAVAATFVDGARPRGAATAQDKFKLGMAVGGNTAANG